MIGCSLSPPRLEAHGREGELWPEAHERLVAASGVESRLLEKRLRLGEPPCFLQCVTELQLELDPGIVGRLGAAPSHGRAG